MMQKTIKILSIIALGIVLLSLFGVCLTTLFWEPYVQLYYGESMSESIPMTLPVSTVVSLGAMLGASILLCICAGNRKVGIWPEISVAVWYGVGGLVTTLLTFFQSALPSIMSEWFRELGVSAYELEYYRVGMNAVSGLWSCATVFTGVATTLFLFICGLSIAYKIHCKKECIALESDDTVTAAALIED